MLTIQKLPLYWRFIEEPLEHMKIPSNIDFTFEIDKSLDLMIEKKTPDLISVLNDIYNEDANIGYMIDGHNLADSYGKDYMNFLNDEFKEFDAKKIVDVGCGGCKVLEILKSMGADVLGVDPSPVALKASKQKKIPIINSFLEKETLKNFNADIILQMDVLEHVFDPIEILKSEREGISNSGKIVINVPNCEFSIESGDISMAIPQHVNMFTRHSLSRVVEEAGLFIENMQLSKYGSAIYCVAGKNKMRSKYSSNKFGFQKKWNDSFFEKANNRINKFKLFSEQNLSDDLGYFIFQRALPYICMTNINLFGKRFFDNNVLWHNKFLDGIPVSIENQEDFLKNPTKDLLIFSNTFGEIIKKELKDKIFNTNIFLQSDVFK